MSYLVLLQSRSKVMVIEIVIFVFEVVWVVGWYIKWAMPDLPIDSSVCVIRERCGSLVLQDVNVTLQFVI